MQLMTVTKVNNNYLRQVLVFFFINFVCFGIKSKLAKKKSDSTIHWHLPDSDIQHKIECF